MGSEQLGYHQSLASKLISPANCLFPHAIAIASYQGKEQGCNKLSLDVASNSEHHEFFGTLATVFANHQKNQFSGMIPEGVIAMLTLQAIEAVSVMHACGIVHNHITLDSFLVVRRPGKQMKHEKAKDSDVSSWFLQVTGFGHRAQVLNLKNAHQQHCQGNPYDYDYQCVANIIHKLLFGGCEISLSVPATGPVEFTSKAFLKGNLFLRGAVCWSSLLDALMCVGEANQNHDGNNIPFQLHYPVNILTISDDDRNGQIGGSCRLLQELSDNTCLDVFMEELCSDSQGGCISKTSRSMFECGSQDSCQSFVCYKSTEQTVEQLMQKENKIQERETELQEMMSQFKKSKAEYQSTIEREVKIEAKEQELLQREQVYALKVQQLERAEKELCLRESRLEQKWLALRHSAQNFNALSIQHWGRNAESHASRESKARMALSNKSGRKRTSHQEPNQTQRYPSWLTEDMPRNSKRKCSENDDSPDLNIKLYKSDKSSTFPKNTVDKQRNVSVLKSSHIDHSDAESECQLEDLHGQSQASHESIGSMKRRKRESRKSPKCSLHNLPTQAKQQSPSPQNRSPRFPPKKVFINFGED